MTGARRVWGAELAVAAAGQLTLLAVLSFTPGLGLTAWVVACCYAVVAFTVLGVARHRPRARGLGPANRVTLVRAVLAGGVTALVVERAGQPLVLATLAALAVGLDTVDGRVARRTGSVSPVGAHFDVEGRRVPCSARRCLRGSPGSWRARCRASCSSSPPRTCCRAPSRPGASPRPSRCCSGRSAGTRCC